MHIFILFVIIVLGFFWLLSLRDKRIDDRRLKGPYGVPCQDFFGNYNSYNGGYLHPTYYKMFYSKPDNFIDTVFNKEYEFTGELRPSRIGDSYYFAQANFVTIHDSKYDSKIKDRSMAPAVWILKEVEK